MLSVYCSSCVVGWGGSHATVSVARLEGWREGAAEKINLRDKVKWILRRKMFQETDVGKLRTF